MQLRRRSGQLGDIARTANQAITTDSIATRQQQPTQQQQQDSNGALATKRTHRRLRPGQGIPAASGGQQEAVSCSAAKNNASSSSSSMSVEAKQQQRQPQQQQQVVTATPTAPLLSSFEAERAARIASNMARLAALELPQLAEGIAAQAAVTTVRQGRPPTQRGVGIKRRRNDEPAVPLRQSARVRREAPDPTTAGGIEYEARDGSVVLAAPGRWAYAVTTPGAIAQVVAVQEPPGPLPFKSSNGDEAADAVFLQLLQQAAAATASRSFGDLEHEAHSSNGSKKNGTGAQLMQLSLAQRDVAKLTRDGVSCIAFHSDPSKLIIAAADKSGKVGLWDIDYQQEEPDGSALAFDGVLMFEPHRDYISSLKWLRPHTLVTSSYDGTVRLLDVNKVEWGLLSNLPGDIDGWSAADVSADGQLVYLATSEGTCTVHDVRSGEGSGSNSTCVIANRKVNTLHLHRNQQHLASSASDGSVAVWDVRMLHTGNTNGSSKKMATAKPVTVACHVKSSQAAYWAPDGSDRLLSISFDDTLRVWKGAATAADPQQMASIRHNNNTGRWVVPFRPVWSPAADTVLVGDLKRGVAMFNAESGVAIGMHNSEFLTAIPSRLALHPAGLTCLAAATSSGRVHIWR